MGGNPQTVAGRPGKSSRAARSQDAPLAHWSSICNHKAKCLAIPLWLVDMEEVLKTVHKPNPWLCRRLSEDHGYCSLAGLPWNDDTGGAQGPQIGPTGTWVVTLPLPTCARHRGRASQAGGGLLPAEPQSPL